MRRHRSLALLAGAALTASFMPLTNADAQVQVMAVEARGGFGGGMPTRINSGSVNKYADLLALDTDQRLIAEELHKGYVAEMQDAEQARRDIVQRLMAEFRETEDGAILGEEMPKAMNEFRERTDRIEQQFFEDLKIVLGEEQLKSWERVERLRRRETVLTRGAISGETVDLMGVSEAIDLPETDDIRGAFAQYEQDLDRLLIEKQRMLDEASYDLPRPGEFDPEEMQERMSASREMGLRIAEVNERYARRLESLLGAEEAARFADEVKRRTFPRVYRESYVDRLIKASMDLEDLSDDQSQTLTEIKLTYARSRGAADDRWAGAIREQDASGDSGGFFAGGMTIRMDFGEQDGDDPVSEARKARRELDQRFEEKVMAVLNPVQKDKMPERGEEREGGAFLIEGGGGPSGVFIRREGGG